MEQAEKMKWWNEARFGMFIHWGLYALPGRGEWVMHAERIPPAEYAKLAQKFRPPKSFKVDSWVKVARDAGMKYMVLTTRHHDGFCLFDSKVSDFTSVKTAAGRDFVAEYVAACRKYGMRIGFYYSLLDWRFPGFHDLIKYPDSFQELVAQAHAQVEELMTNYGKIDILWYDGGWLPKMDQAKVFFANASLLAGCWKSDQLNGMARRLQPGIIINNRSGLPEDFDTPEQHIEESENNRCWESCMTIGDFCSWGYVKHNPNLKPTSQLLQQLVICAGKGGNHILNVGPKPDGTIQKEYLSRLKEIGRWMKVNGESVYGTEKVPAQFGYYGAGISGAATARGNTVYLHMFRWPGKTAIVTGIKNRILSARLLATGKRVGFSLAADGKYVFSGLPEEPPDKYDTVLALELSGKPETFDYCGVPF